MHRKEDFELIITGKLAALPLPDMADAIWARIEQQLDLDMPTDESGGDVPEPPAPPTGGGGRIAIGAGMMVLIGALIVYFTWPKPNTQPTDTTTDLIEKNTSPDPNNAKPSTVLIPALPQPGRALAPPAGSTVVTAPTDSTEANSLVQTNPLAPDSTQAVATTNVVVPDVAPPVPRKDSTPQKQRRGAQGISNKDYRIVPKDSAQ